MRQKNPYFLGCMCLQIRPDLTQVTVGPVVFIFDHFGPILFMFSRKIFLRKLFLIGLTKIEIFFIPQYEWELGSLLFHRFVSNLIKTFLIVLVDLSSLQNFAFYTTIRLCSWLKKLRFSLFQEFHCNITLHLVKKSLVLGKIYNTIWLSLVYVLVTNQVGKICAWIDSCFMFNVTCGGTSAAAICCLKEFQGRS